MLIATYLVDYSEIKTDYQYFYIDNFQLEDDEIGTLEVELMYSNDCTLTGDSTTVAAIIKGYEQYQLPVAKNIALFYKEEIDLFAPETIYYPSLEEDMHEIEEFFPELQYKTKYFDQVKKELSILLIFS